MSQLNSKEFQYVRKLSWKEVVDIWRLEEKKKYWRERWEGWGFKSWYDWRKRFILPLKTLKKQWELYKVLDPIKSVPNFHGGPFTPWEKYYNDLSLPRFKDMKVHPEAEQYAKHFPKKTTLITLSLGGRVIVFEGMHRASAIALCARKKKPFRSPLYIAVAPCNLDELRKILKNYH